MSIRLLAPIKNPLSKHQSVVLFLGINVVIFRAEVAFGELFQIKLEDPNDGILHSQLPPAVSPLLIVDSFFHQQ